MSSIASESIQRKEGDRILKKARQNQKNLDLSETNMKFGLFCITFMYFRALHMVRREKESWSGQHDLIGKKVKQKLTAERQKMNQEEENARRRQNFLCQAMEKAKTGEERMRTRRETVEAEKASEIYDWGGLSRKNR